jgi:undecaprenyl diphosphate synthase
MDLMEKFFREEHEKNKEDSLFGKIKLKVVGERGKLSDKIKKIIKRVEEDTKNNTSMILNIAFSYGGRMEIVEAIKKIIEKKIPLNEINEKVIKENLSVPDLDLIIRTGREQRLSNFFIWQSAYSELYFSNKYWPDFSEDDFDKALKEYERRQRRFGK